MLHPLVSVILPVYNADIFLKESIESILAQTYKRIQLIIIDDGSTDNSWSIITHYQNKYPRLITSIHLKKNINEGGNASANIGIQRAKGTYIARMDADDIAEPTRLEKQVRYLAQHPDVFMVGSSALVIDKDGNAIGEKIMPGNHAEIYNQYMLIHPIIHPTVVFRNNVLNRKCFYLCGYSANNDYYTFFDLISQGYKFANLPEKLLRYRIYGNNTSLKSIKSSYFNTVQTRIHILKKYGYPLNAKIVIINILQFLLILIAPEKLIFYTYLLSRGIISPSSIFTKIRKKIISMIYHQLSVFLVS